MSDIKQFKDQEDHICANAAIPDVYRIGGSIVNKMQHEGVPFTVTAHAIDAAKGVFIYGLTDEMYTTYLNTFVKQNLNMIPGIIWTSIRDFVEPEEFLKQFAEAISMMKLTPVAYADLPSIFGKNVKKFYDDMMAEYQVLFDRETSLGTPTFPNNTVCRAMLIKYKGVNQNGRECTVLAGMDYKGVEYYTTVTPLSVMGPLGGLLGGLMQKKQAEKGSTQFGHGKPCDVIDWGAQNKFVLITPVEYEAETTPDFLEFVSTFHMEDSLRQQFYQMKAERAMQMTQQIAAQNAQLQQQLQIQRQNLMMNQQRLAQTLARNSAEMSAGIMDSWNKKMASDSRISQARSEAIRGVNVYQNSYGQNVDVSVTADHVYQNRLGEVFGVSGVAPDQTTLNQLNWTEIKK